MQKKVIAVLALCLSLSFAFAQTSGPQSRPWADGQRSTLGSDALKALGDDFKPMMEMVPGGQVDWTRWYVIGVGTGKAQGETGQQIEMAKRAARLLAARNAVLAMRGLRTGGGGRFKDLKEGTIRVEVVLKGMQELSSRFDPDTNTATVRVRLPIYGIDGLVSVSGLVLAEEGKLWSGRSVLSTLSAKRIVIDTRGSGFVPEAFPQIVTQDGQIVLGPKDFTGEQLSTGSTFAYVTSTKEEPTALGVLLVKAARTESNSLVLDPQQLKRLFPPSPKGGTGEPDALKFWKTGKVIILIDSPAPKKSDRAGRAAQKD